MVERKHSLAGAAARKGGLQFADREKSESHIVEFSGNYYILKVDEKRGGETKSLEQARPDIEKLLVQQEAQDLQERWIASLRSKAYIKTF